MQIAGTAVIAQTTPQAQHLIERGRCQIFHRGKARKKALVVVDHGEHLSLLQHDLRQPHAVRLARVLPGQVGASMGLMPVQQAL